MSTTAHGPKGTEFLEGSKEHQEILEALFNSKSQNYMLGLIVHIVIGISGILFLGITLDDFFFTWWVIGATIALCFAWFESSLIEVEKIERLVVTLWNEPVLVLGAGRWWLPFNGWILDCNPEHKTDVQLQETKVPPVTAMTTDSIKMHGSGIVNWRIANATEFMLINEKIMDSNLQTAAQAELQEIIIKNNKVDCIVANKELRDRIKAKNTQLHDLADEYGVEIIACSLVITQSEASMTAEEKRAIEKAEAEVLKMEKAEFLDLKKDLESGGMSSLDASQLALALMGKGSSFNFIGKAGDFTKGAAIK